MRYVPGIGGQIELLLGFQEYYATRGQNRLLSLRSSDQAVRPQEARGDHPSGAIRCIGDPHPVQPPTRLESISHGQSGKKVVPT